MPRKYAPRAAPTGDPYVRLLAAVALRTTRDLQLSNPRLRRQALAFFDNEGIALTAALVGVSPARIRQKVQQAVTNE
ncbi:MAG: hypothetical protein Kow0031_01140 [Anaerolineae bacterium]